MPSALEKEASVIFKPHRKTTGKYIGNCLHCEQIGAAKGLL